MTVLELELQAALLAARPKKEIIWVLSVTLSQVCLWTGSNTFLQWIKSNDKQLTFIARRVCKTLVYTSIDQWNQVASKDNTADAVTRGLIYVSRSHLTKASLIILNLLSTKQSLSKTLNLSLHLLKTDNYRFTVIPIWYVEFASTCILLHTFSNFCQNIPATVTSMVALLTLLNFTTPSVISNNWCKVCILKPKVGSYWQQIC